MLYIGQKGGSSITEKEQRIKLYKELVDIRSVLLSENLSKVNKINSYLGQIKNPYHYMYKDIEVVANFSENGLSIEDCIKRLML